MVELAQEVIAHIRQAAGPDALLDAFNQAMTAVKTARAERKRQQAVQVRLTLNQSWWQCVAPLSSGREWMVMHLS